MCKVSRFTLHQCPRNFRRCTQTMHWPYLVNWWSLCRACAVSRLVFKQLFGTVSIILLRKSSWHLLTRIASLLSTRNILRFQSTYYPWVNQVEFLGWLVLRMLKWQNILCLTCSKKVQIHTRVEITNFTVVREMLHNNWTISQPHWSLPLLATRPFLACREVCAGWARDWDKRSMRAHACYYF